MVNLAVYLLGLPGAGKSTLAASLRDLCDGVVLSGGSLLRRWSRASGEGSDEAGHAVNHGKPVHDRLIADLYMAELSRNPGTRCALLDGSPASVDQFARINGLLCSLGFAAAPPLIIYLSPPAEECRRRLRAPRYFCERCFVPARQERRCADCGGAAVPRPESTTAAMSHRLTWHDTVTVPLVRSAAPGSVLRITGTPTREECVRRAVVWLAGHTSA